MSHPTQDLHDEFTTSDLATAAFLVTKEIPLLRVDRFSDRAVFVFPAGARDKARCLFQPGQDLVPARKFHQTVRELRGLARGDRR